MPTIGNAIGEIDWRSAELEAGGIGGGDGLEVCDELGEAQDFLVSDSRR